MTPSSQGMEPPENPVRFKEIVGGDPMRARQAMTRAVRDQQEFAGPKQMWLCARDFDPTFTGGDHMKHHAVLEWRQRERPGRGEFGAAIKHAAHAQEMERFAKRIDRFWKCRHNAQYIWIWSSPDFVDS